jgi:membrane protease YdiL (CAAX protease family)
MRRPDAAATAAAATLAYNAVVNRVVPRRWHVPANLAAAGALVAFARHAGASDHDLGLDRTRLARGVRIGIAVATPVAGVVAILATHPTTRSLFADDRFARGGARTARYEALVRIPLATALAEEVIFRGVLVGLAGRRHDPVRAAMWSAAIFGLWHVLPTLEGVEPLGPGPTEWSHAGGVAGAVAANVAATAAAGLAFSWLRAVSGSIVAPAIVHAAVNATAYAGGRHTARGQPAAAR